MTFIPSVLTSDDANNSITSVLTSSSTFTGTGTLTTGFDTLVLTVKSNVDSTSGGIQIQFSNDNSTFATFYSDTYFASANFFTKSYQITKKYYRVVYTNGDANQTTFEITARLSTCCPSDNNSNNSITVFDNDMEASLDAFGKLRVSMPNTLLDIRFPANSIASGANTAFLQNNTQVCTKSSGSYSAIYEKSKAVIAGTNVGYYISQSRNYITYQPGKSLLFMSSGILNPDNSGFTARLGLFDNEFSTSPSYPTVNNGIYFEYSGGSASVNLKNDSVTTIPQSSWNVDKMNGTGPSGLNLDFTKTQLFIMDMEWLGVGRVRFGFYAFGRIHYCHQILNINVLTSPYTNNINLPICYSLHATSPSAGSGTIRQICSTVISEGGYNPVGKPFTTSNSQGGVDIPVTVPVAETALLAIRGGGSNYYHQNIIPTGISVIDTATNNNLLYRLRLYLGGNSPGTVTWSFVDSSNSVVQYAKSGNIASFTTANSILLDQGYFYGRGTIAFNGLGNVFSNLILQITANVDHVSDIMVLTCEKIGQNSTEVYSTISWQEIY
jgi:hypothetical protein